MRGIQAAQTQSTETEPRILASPEIAIEEFRLPQAGEAGVLLPNSTSEPVGIVPINEQNDHMFFFNKKTGRNELLAQNVSWIVEIAQASRDCSKMANFVRKLVVFDKSCQFHTGLEYILGRSELVLQRQPGENVSEVEEIIMPVSSIHAIHFEKYASQPAPIAVNTRQ